MMWYMLMLAVVQGVTEFLPISSSGHLVLVSEVFGGEAHHYGFDIVLHAATLGAVMVYFRKDVRRLTMAFFSRQSSPDRMLARALVLAALPIMGVGVLVYPVFASLRALPIVATALIISGGLLIIADYSVRRGWVRTDVPLWRRGIGVGLLQVFALLPGVSRSGITIAAGRLLGFSRKEASRFSFLLAIPVILGALVVLLSTTPLTADSFGGVHGSVLAAGGLVAFAVAYAVIHVFLKFIERVGFLPFFIYQVLLGCTILLVAY